MVFANIIALVPFGELITSEVIYDLWAKRKGADFCEAGNGLLPINTELFYKDLGIQRIDIITNFPKKETGRTAIPYWRIVTKTEFLQDFGHYSSKESQKAMLESEGHTIVESRKNSFRVENYKEKLFDLDRLIIPGGL